MVDHQQVMSKWVDSLSEEERAIVRKSRQETKKHMSERVPQPIVFSYGTSSPGYCAILETETKV